MNIPTQAPSRITMRSIFNAVLDIFDLERGLLHTIVALTWRPGDAIRNYIETDRTRLSKPFRFLLLTIAVATVITHQYFNDPAVLAAFQQGFTDNYQLGTEIAGGEGEASSGKALKAMQQWNEWFNNYFNLFLLLGVPVLASSTRIIFRQPYNYAEHLVINSYVTAYLTVLYIITTPLLFLNVSFTTFSVGYFVATLIYTIFTYTQLFGVRLLTSLFKGLLANIIYILIYYIIIVIIVVAMLFSVGV